MKNECYGEIPCIEQNGAWKMHKYDSDVSRNEFDQVYRDFESWLEDYYENKGAPKDQMPCYFIGDFPNERTQQLEFNNHNARTGELIYALQGVLKLRGNNTWRIAVGAYWHEDVIMVYQNAICRDRVLQDHEIECEVHNINLRHIDRDRRKEVERSTRLDRVLPFLKDAYITALDGRVGPRRVLVEKGNGKDDGLIRMWVLLPRKVDVLDIGEYSVTPDACVIDNRYLLPTGEVLDTRRPMPSDALLLTLWEFEENPDRVFVMERGHSRTHIQY